jgi:hypothetical protein
MKMDVQAQRGCEEQQQQQQEWVQPLAVPERKGACACEKQLQRSRSRDCRIGVCISLRFPKLFVKLVFLGACSCSPLRAEAGIPQLHWLPVPAGPPLRPAHRENAGRRADLDL